MSFGKHSQSINIDRIQLIGELNKGLAAHKAEYEEALAEYKTAVLKFMKETLTRVENGDFSDLTMKFNKPTSHEIDYTNVIELLGFSVDTNINLDADAFRSYVKNEWSWKSSFDLHSQMIKGYLAG